MHIKTKLGMSVLLLAFAAACFFSQTKMPAETHNAALRYWMAFAELQDTGADQAAATLINKTLSGEVPWDEAQVGHIIDDNLEPLAIMQRATKLPDCDWGLEYGLGPRTPLPFVRNSARTLARLNTLYALRLISKGDAQNATDSVLAGIRFSQNLAKGESLLATLVSNAALVFNFKAAMRGAQSNVLNSAQRKQVQVAVQELPETGFDWGLAMWYEVVPMDTTIREMEKAASPAAYYQEMIVASAPQNFTVPRASDVAAFHQLMGKIEAALRMPPEQPKDRLKSLQASEKSLHPFFQAIISNLSRINDVRAETQTLRKNLLQAVAEK